MGNSRIRGEGAALLVILCAVLGRGAEADSLVFEHVDEIDVNGDRSLGRQEVVAAFKRVMSAVFSYEKGVASTSSYSQSKVRWRVFFCFCRDAVQLLGLCSSQPSPFPQTGVLWRSAGRQFGFESPA